MQAFWMEVFVRIDQIAARFDAMEASLGRVGERLECMPHKLQSAGAQFDRIDKKPGGVGRRIPGIVADLAERVTGRR